VLTRIRRAWLASAGATLLVLMFTGLAAGRVVLNDSGTTVTADAPAAPDTTATFEDTNGNGIDDDCETNVVADPVKAAEADKAVDTNADGVISVSEAAHSPRIGGKNCNHGGYVSSVANGGADEQSGTTDESAPTTCVPVPLPERDPSLDGQKDAHGKWMSTVAQSDATGGKNCNHGGAVSDASKADNALRKALRDAARAAAKAARQQGKDENGGD